MRKSQAYNGQSGAVENVLYLNDQKNEKTLRLSIKIKTNQGYLNRSRSMHKIIRFK